MEQRSMSDTIKKLEPLLRKFEDDNGLIIQQVKDEQGTNKGDNYTSIMIRMTVVGRYGNGSPYEKKFMTKILSLTRATSEIMNTKSLYLIEGHTYEKILPIVGDFGPRFVLLDKDEIIMEDLCQSGYFNCKRQNYLDLEHSLITIEYLAKFHAKSLSIKLNDPENFEKLTNPIREYIFPADSTNPIGTTIENGMIWAINHLESVNDLSEDLKNMIEYLKSLKNQCYDRMVELFNLPEEKYFTICHGDMWINNILFKHDENGKVTDLKFVDYQIVRNTSIATDFLYFVYTSVRSSFIENNYDTLVEHYHSHFLKYLQEDGVSKEHRQNMNIDWFKSELKRFSLYGLLCGFWLIHVVLADENNIIDIDKLTENGLEYMDTFLSHINENKMERYKCIASHYFQTYVK